jgi:hypothetical protein
MMPWKTKPSVPLLDCNVSQQRRKRKEREGGEKKEEESLLLFMEDRTMLTVSRLLKLYICNHTKIPGTAFFLTVDCRTW